MELNLKAYMTGPAFFGRISRRACHRKGYLFVGLKVFRLAQSKCLYVMRRIDGSLKVPRLRQVEGRYVGF
jgi:hypothetical protein